MLLHDGKHRFTGDTEEAISLFHEVINEPREMEDPVAAGAGFERGSVEIESVEILDPSGRSTASVPCPRDDDGAHGAALPQAHREPGVRPLGAQRLGRRRLQRQLAPPGRKRVYRDGERATCDIVLRTRWPRGRTG